MDFKLAHHQDLSSLMNIFHEAQRYLASQDVDQWQDGYPTEDIIIIDIDNRENYLVKNEEGVIMGTTMFTTNPEPTYTQIDGAWLTDEDVVYGVIHRMAVSNAFKKMGIAQFIFDQCEQMLKDKNIASMRIDTHEDNKGMGSLLKKLGYTYCGIIFLEDGDKRLAFEKLMT